MACNWNSSCQRSARIRDTNESIRKRGAPATRTAPGVEPPEGALASPVERPHKTKNKSKRNQSTVQTETSYRTETTPTVPKLCEYSQLCLSVCCRVQCRILFGQNRTHLLHCVCTCEQTALLRVCYDGKLVNQQRNGYAERIVAMDDNY